MLSELTTFALAVALAFVQVNAESHTVTFNNRCGYGTPYLRASNGAVLSTGGSYTSNGALVGAIAVPQCTYSYLQTGSCGNNGEECTLIETTLRNGYSSTDISLIPPSPSPAASATTTAATAPVLTGALTPM
ncbi:hypothetical protein POSPLDRAFT_95888 [Postia placenta Mad-698-R]|nr:hypothetical protein POSPLDRAFT_95888 [Postia placenta Mad-698-R]